MFPNLVFHFYTHSWLYNSSFVCLNPGWPSGFLHVLNNDALTQEPSHLLFPLPTVHSFLVLRFTSFLCKLIQMLLFWWSFTASFLHFLKFPLLFEFFSFLKQLIILVEFRVYIWYKGYTWWSLGLTSDAVLSSHSWQSQKVYKLCPGLNLG